MYVLHNWVCVGVWGPFLNELSTFKSQNSTKKSILPPKKIRIRSRYGYGYGYGAVMPIPEHIPLSIPIFNILAPYPFFVIFCAHTHYKWGGFGVSFSNLGTTPVTRTRWRWQAVTRSRSH